MAARASHIAAVTAGNALEFYDFLVYATFAVYIGHAYFPSHDPFASLMASLATFGIGFTTRPLGGIVIGRLGDRWGRRPALLLTFLLMGVGMAGLALTPGYDRIGVAAPILAVLFRMLQGFALGGEVGPSTAFLVEAAGPRRRGLAGSAQAASQGIATLTAAAVGVTLSLVLSPAALADWGWRIALLLGLAIVPFGLLARRTLPETLHETLHESRSAPAGPVVGVGSRWSAPAGVAKVAALGLGIVASGTIGTYVLLYLPTYALTTLHLAPGAGFGVGLVNGGCILVFGPLGGLLSDRFGRKRVMIPGLAVSLLVTLPAFAWVVAHPSVEALYLAVFLVSAPGVMCSAAALVAITESFGPAVRSTAMGTVYALAVAVFGGTTQMMVAWLTQATHEPLAPFLYRVAAGAVGLGAMLMLPESAPVRETGASPALAPPAAVAG